jgi:hypothetical protein
MSDGGLPVDGPDDNAAARGFAAHGAAAAQAAGLDVGGGSGAGGGGADTVVNASDDVLAWAEATDPSLGPPLVVLLANREGCMVTRSVLKTLVVGTTRTWPLPDAVADEQRLLDELIRSLLEARGAPAALVEELQGASARAVRAALHGLLSAAHAPVVSAPSVAPAAAPDWTALGMGVATAAVTALHKAGGIGGGGSSDTVKPWTTTQLEGAEAALKTQVGALDLPRHMIPNASLLARLRDEAVDQATLPRSSTVAMDKMAPFETADGVVSSTSRASLRLLSADSPGEFMPGGFDEEAKDAVSLNEFVDKALSYVHGCVLVCAGQDCSGRYACRYGCSSWCAFGRVYPFVLHLTALSRPGSGMTLESARGAVSVALQDGKAAVRGDGVDASSRVCLGHGFAAAAASLLAQQKAARRTAHQIAAMSRGRGRGGVSDLAAAGLEDHPGGSPPHRTGKGKDGKGSPAKRERDEAARKQKEQRKRSTWVDEEGKSHSARIGGIDSAPMCTDDRHKKNPLSWCAMSHVKWSRGGPPGGGSSGAAI